MTPDRQRKAAERARMRAKGFKLAQFWVHPDDFEKVASLVARLRRKRLAE
jgi:L-alanine-DL-glutamate epimerase-like enolase superfamily enzyme